MANRNREYIDFLKQRFDENKFIEFISDLLNLSSEDINSFIAEIYSSVGCINNRQSPPASKKAAAAL